MYQEPITIPGNDKSVRNVTMLVYALQALYFFFGITLFAAIIINYVKRDDVKNTWLESHFRWQIRTFWFSLLWTAIGFVTLIFFIGYIILSATMFWFIYRIAKGWLNLANGKEMYQTF